MNKTLVLLAGLLLTTVPLGAETYEYPSGDPVFQITFPDTWKTAVQDGNVITAQTPDEAIFNMIWMMPEGVSQEEALNAIDEEIKSSIKDISFGKPSIQKVNGLSLLVIDGTAKTVDGEAPITVSVIFFKPEGSQNFKTGKDFFVKDDRADFVWLYFGATALEPKWEKDIESVIKSLKKVK